VLRHRKAVSALAALADGRLASGGEGGTVRVWDVTAAGACVALLKGHADSVCALAVLGNGRLASGSGDSTVRVCNMATGACDAVIIIIITITGNSSVIIIIIKKVNAWMVAHQHSRCPVTRNPRGAWL
jgi:WD40 repeat protein